MMEAFARLLHETIGLDPESIGMSTIERTVRPRMAAHQAGTPAPIPQLVTRRALIPPPPPKLRPVPKTVGLPVPAPVAAEEGRLDRVASICHAFLQKSGASAQAYYLLGLVHDAADRGNEAAACYRKALYLHPQHHDALVHYSLLTAKRGDANAAQALRDRARRSTGKAA